MSFFRVIIPNNNSEPWIRHGLDSIVSQSFKDWELVIIDDHSEDKSPEIVAEYAEKYPIIFKRLEEKKGFPGDVRMEAIKYAQDSEYTIFLDSDDWFNDQFVFERVKKKADETHADIIRMPFIIYMAPSNVVPVMISDSTLEQFIESPFVAPWTKAVKTSKTQPFEIQSIYDDISNHLALADTIDTVTSISDYCVVWNRQESNKNSVTVDINGTEWKRRKYHGSLFRLYSSCVMTKYNRPAVQNKADGWAGFAKTMIQEEKLL